MCARRLSPLPCVRPIPRQPNTSRAARCWFPRTPSGVVTTLPTVQLPTHKGLRTLLFVAIVLVSCSPCCACVGVVLLAASVSDRCHAQRWLGRLRCDVPAALALGPLGAGAVGDTGVVGDDLGSGDPAATKAQ
jgi:hypothetical protein